MLIYIITTDVRFDGGFQYALCYQQSVTITAPPKAI